MATVAVLDYGSSNLRSVAKALQAVAAPDMKVRISTTAAELRRADRIVFPGQGAIGQCMQRLQALDLIEALTDCLRDKPFLGICLGMQSLFSTSEENGGTPCLNIVPGTVRRFPAGAGLKVPHMGWNQVRQRLPHPLWEDIPGGERFYFVHSYYVAPADDTNIAGSTDYGIDFTSAVAHENLFAVQFHPEKSQRPGLALLRNFLHWQP
ncbi:MAG: imidazole glycerol phosphate synthase, glutamine amidotransferase subunit [Gammaproteobacteria bacterium RIFCSPLOWO2_02_FULL_61_13]|nr:MAG: imidazole glycerol phosphate synthase, glutamine amidotransferase subunit [Gammaproteobacteria bacterium RIFCSPLOWO2_02_FULL_61_13]